MATVGTTVTDKKVQAYDGSSITILEGRDAVRKRPAMYIGSTGEIGLHHIVYEVVDNSIDEALAGYCDTVEVAIHLDNSITVIDNGRGIPVDEIKKEKRSAAEVVMTKLHAGGKFDTNAYKVSGGLHGVGVSCVNFLSEHLHLEIWRDGKTYEQEYVRGVPVVPLKQTGKTRKRGTKITFLPDSQIFTETAFSFDKLSERLREKAFLNKGIRITIKDEREEPERSHEFYYKGGIAEFVKHLNKNKSVLHDKPIYFEKKATHSRSRWLSNTTTLTTKRSIRLPTTSTLSTVAHTYPDFARPLPEPSTPTHNRQVWRRTSKPLSQEMMSARDWWR